MAECLGFSEFVEQRMSALGLSTPSSLYDNYDIEGIEAELMRNPRLRPPMFNTIADTILFVWLHITEWYIAYSLSLAAAVWIFGYSVDYFLVKTDRVLDKDCYTLDEIRDMKRKSFLHSWSAYRRLDRVKEINNAQQGLGWYAGYRKKQRMYSDL